MHNHKFTKTTLGVDGCRGGWMWCKISPTNVSYGFSQTLEALPFTEVSDLWIDMPIGLLPSTFRSCDQLAAKALGPRRHSIFAVPPHEMLSHHDYQEAVSHCRELTTKGFSIQLWHILPKIRQLQHFLLSKTKRPYFYESHPELCFSALTGGQSLTLNKKTSEGQKVRLDALSNYQLNPLANYDALTPARGRFVKDDLIDATVLALAAQFPAVNLEQTKVSPEGLKINIRTLNSASNKSFI